MAMPYPVSMYVPQADNLKAAHPGLIFSHLFDGYKNDFSDLQAPVRDNRRNVEISDPKKDFMRKCNIGQAAWKQMNDEVLLRQVRLIEQTGGDFWVISSIPGSPFLTGIGISHPLENGFLWHPVYPCPYVPGSSLKGLLRAWFETSPSIDEQEKRSLLKVLFGSDHKDPRQAQMDFTNGGLVFFDALPVSDWQIQIQMLTPHVGKYYEQGRERPDQVETLPADWHLPVPVPFMALNKISFLVGFAPSSTGEKLDEGLLRLIRSHLEVALSSLGMGAKTALGYGRFQLDEKETEKLHKSLEAYQEELVKAALPEQQRLIVEQAKKVKKLPVSTLKPGAENFEPLRQAFEQAETWEDPDLTEFVQEVFIPWWKAVSPSKKWKDKNKDKFTRLFQKRQELLNA